MNDPSTRNFLASLRSTFHRLSTLPIPTISAISSIAFGGGLELALCTNFRVLASTASIGLPETRLAIIPGGGGTYRLPALIGTARARDLILTGRRVSGEEAYFIGLADRLVQIEEKELSEKGVARGKILDEAIAMAKTICEGGPIAIRAAHAAVSGWREGAESENKAYNKVIPTKDRLEALKAFGEKRKPQFYGR
jgi:methylglutaconyl-CoA hydratase